MALKILFVDDEPNILQSMRRALRGMARDWDMQFAKDGAEAIQMLAQGSFDVVATDLHMPGLDGAGLLTEVQRRWPTTLRIITSGSCAQKEVVRSVGFAHQYLSKPYDAATLKSAIDKAMSLRELITDPGLAGFVSGIQRLPSLPDVHRQLTVAIQDDTKSIREIGDLVTQDIALTAKVMQVVNSAFFALPRRVSSPGEAAIILGLDVLRALVLATEVFSSLDADAECLAGIRQIWSHSLGVANAARLGARALQCDRAVEGAAFLAGMMHEIGSIVFLLNRPADYQRCELAVAQSGRLMHEVEKEVLGTTHAHVGGYLLGIWGLPEDVVTGVVFHHRPAETDANGIDPLCLVHLADNLDPTAARPALPGLDHDYVEGRGISGRLGEICQAMAAVRS
jgi:HD-like signal output (HDOD) protein/CheY-like chemotaxis protein